MQIPKETQDYIRILAEETLSIFDSVSKAATARLSREPISPENSFASPNVLTSTKAIHELERILETNRKSLEKLVEEPAIARVVAEKREVPTTYYICRLTPITSAEALTEMASYHSPVGRLASLPIGEEISLSNGDTLRVLEKALLRPERKKQRWDSRNSEIHRALGRPLTVDSLRAFLSTQDVEEIDEDLVQRLIDEERRSDNVVEGLRRSVLMQMALRDQPILDQFQDSIFRLPLDSCLVLLGPPGTGKTTTLIRRLGQKLDFEFLEEEERRVIRRVSGQNRRPHASSWIMFTPTALLCQYVKESFFARSSAGV